MRDAAGETIAGEVTKGWLQAGVLFQRSCDSGIVVEADAVDTIVPSNLCDVGEADIGVVYADRAALVVIGDLDEGADIVRDAGPHRTS